MIVVIAAIVGCRSAGDSTDDGASRGAFLPTNRSSDNAANGGAGQYAGLGVSGGRQGSGHEQRSGHENGNLGRPLARLAGLTIGVKAH